MRLSFTHYVLFQQEMEDKVTSPEKAEEAKLKARYPNLGAKPGGSDLLRKRLQKGVCFISQPSIFCCLFTDSNSPSLTVFSLSLGDCPAKVF